MKNGITEILFGVIIVMIAIVAVLVSTLVSSQNLIDDFKEMHCQEIKLLKKANVDNDLINKILKAETDYPICE